MSKGGGGGDEDSSNNHDLKVRRRTIDGGDNDSSSQRKDPQQSHKKRVRFADQVDEMTLPALPEDFAEICQIYWVRDALKTIRVSLKLTARDIRKKHSRQVQALEFAYSLAAQLVDDDGKEAAELSSNDSMLLHDVSEQAAQLKPWCCCLINGRGLERQVSNQQRLERANAVERSRRLVLNMSSSSNANAEETIAHAYGEQARVATVFARIAGQADAVVAAATEQEQRRRRRPSALEVLVRRNSHRHMLMNDIQQQRDHAHHHHHQHFL